MGHMTDHKPSKKTQDWADECYLMAVRFGAGAAEERKCRHMNAVYIKSIIDTLQPATQLYAIATIENLLS